MSDRRQFLGTLGKALGLGGLLIPIAGKGALALPADLGKAAGLPVRAAALPISREGLQLRELRRVIHAVHTERGPRALARAMRHHALMVDDYEPLALSVTAREQPTWADCVELAEICWQGLAKEWQDPTVFIENSGYTGALQAYDVHHSGPGMPRGNHRACRSRADARQWRAILPAL
jgi:hypothetical protein